MEEIRSTEALDKEILEDARKKAFKILKSADESAARVESKWQEKTKVDLAAITASYEAKSARERDEIMARLPLDKRRLRSEKADATMKDAMRAFLGVLPRDILLKILKSEFSARLSACIDWIPDTQVVGGTASSFVPFLEYAALTENEAKTIFDQAFAEAQPAFDGKNVVLRANTRPYAPEFPSFVLETSTVKINASVETAAANLLESKRAELASALLGEEALND
jgi:vacuolar-type H+-ATPase subunit H